MRLVHLAYLFYLQEFHYFCFSQFLLTHICLFLSYMPYISFEMLVSYYSSFPSSTVFSSFFLFSSYAINSLNCVSLFISIFQFVSFTANLAFCPPFPIANDNSSSGTITCANFSSSLISTAITCAGNNAAHINVAGSSLHSITSIFSPFISFIMF